MDSNYKKLLVSRDGRVVTAKLSNSGFGNSIDQDLHVDLERFFHAAADDATIGAVVLTGEGDVFSAGGDLRAMQEPVERPELFYSAMIRAKRLVFAILDCPVPIIARINGDAMGLGATLALLCDVSIATEEARIADPHVKVGFVAGDGGALIWPLLIGYARAKRYLLTGEAIQGREAAEIGLITAAVPATELDEEVARWSRRLSSGAQRAINWTKMTMNVALRQQASAVMEAGMAYEVVSNMTKDHREAVNALAERRKPIFTGD